MAQLSALAFEREKTIHRLVIILIIVLLILCVAGGYYALRRQHKKAHRLNQTISEMEIENNQLNLLLDDLRNRKETLEADLKNTENKLAKMEASLNQTTDTVKQLSADQAFKLKYEESLKKELQENRQKILLLTQEKNSVLLTMVRTEANKLNNLVAIPNQKNRGTIEIIADKYRDAAVLQELRRVINDATSGLLDCLASEAGLSADRLTMIIYDMCGFNYHSIARILNISESNASVRKSRLKKLLTGISDTALLNRIYLHVPLMKRES